MNEYFFARVDLHGTEDVQGAETAREPPDANCKPPNEGETHHQEDNLVPAWKAHVLFVIQYHALRQPVSMSSYLDLSPRKHVHQA